MSTVQFPLTDLSLYVIAYKYRHSSIISASTTMISTASNWLCVISLSSLRSSLVTTLSCSLKRRRRNLSRKPRKSGKQRCVYRVCLNLPSWRIKTKISKSRTDLRLFFYRYYWLHCIRTLSVVPFFFDDLPDRLRPPTHPAARRWQRRSPRSSHPVPLRPASSPVRSHRSRPCR